MAFSIYWSVVTGGYFRGSKATRAWRWPLNLHLLPRLRMCGAIPLHLHLASWHVKGYFCLYFVNYVYCTHVTHSVSSIDELRTSPTVDSYFHFAYFFIGSIFQPPPWLLKVHRLPESHFPKYTYRRQVIYLFLLFNFTSLSISQTVFLAWIYDDYAFACADWRQKSLTYSDVYSCCMITYIIYIFS